eukprot:CAMPEP_0176037844 /NCGR_PEP_ID=MMETSP0120_2-20121206/18751_1 /TAXON_ID=160619 /ORGANISM="Kryptoperidinium foliaceum, Strain CCMP 1326" /LENGTH=433 /DNA_ID=CAMNT_0017371235 /DNA_START=29 /DNA_END=1330 /DNA_ORIENTATION=-
MRGQVRSFAAAEEHAGIHQTPIVDQLWAKRKQAQQQAAAVAPAEPSKSGERVLVSKTPEDSAQSVTYQFSNPEKQWLVDKYRNPWGHVRPGRLFEDLDALAGTIAFEHCRGTNPQEKNLHIVTASVDRIKYLHRPNLEDNLVLAGKVTYVGRSSMEIHMKAQAEWSDAPFMESTFTFVARDPDTGRAAQINPLKVSGPEQEALFDMGAKRDAARKEARKLAKESAVGRPLDSRAMKTAHALMAEAQPLITMPSLANQRDVLMSSTRLQNTFMTMPQQRNTAGRVFGGFLMRRAYELARSTAHLFGGRRPVFHELDEVTFLAPVNVGDMVTFESCVLYTSEKIDPQGRATIHTEVKAHVLRPESRSVTLSNTFNFTFGLADNVDGSGGSALGSSVSLRRVLPGTYGEAYRIVERYGADLAQVAEDSHLAQSEGK